MRKLFHHKYLCLKPYTESIIGAIKWKQQEVDGFGLPYDKFT